MKKLVIFFLMAFNCLIVICDTVTVTVINTPINHPHSEDIYIAGDFNGWAPADPNYKLTKNPDNTYIIVLQGSGTINFKFTRGTWGKVEKGSFCNEISERSYTFGSSPNYDATIYYWADLCSEYHTATPNVSIIDNSFYIPQLNRHRKIWIYLPPDYHTTNKHYPVLYMQDAQNLFDEYFCFSGEWEVDEALNYLFSIGDPGCIVVGIDNGGSHRLDEYSPWVNPTYGGGEGGLYAQFIVETLKPYVDSIYRTIPNRLNTGIMGSSMGALISFYAGIKYQSVFSKIGVFSPSFWFSDQCYTFAKQTPKSYDMRLYFLGGTPEPGVVQNCNKMIDTLLSNGYLSSEIEMKEVSNGQHSEWFWNQEFPDAYNWLFAIVTQINSMFVNEISVFPNPTNDFINITIETECEEYLVKIFDVAGGLVYEKNHKSSNILIDVSDFSKGFYSVKISTIEKGNQNKYYKSKFVVV